MSYAHELARVQERIKLHTFAYRTRVLMLWLLALACWLVPWWTAIPMVFCAVVTAVLAFVDLRVRQRLIDHRCELLAAGERGPADGVFR